jgi:hypothetical protein
MASAWLRAPAFFAVFPIVSITWAPCAVAIRAVSSVQLSATTMIRSGRRSCRTRLRKVAASCPASLWAGISTTTARGCPAHSGHK